MKIALISGVPLIARSEIGAAYFTRDLAIELARRGVDVEIWSKRGVGEEAPTGAHVVPAWRPGWLAWWDVMQTVRARRPDIVHIQHSIFTLGPGASGEFSMLLLLVLLRIAGKRVVVTAHDIPALDQITPAYVRMHGYKFPAPVVVAGLRVLFGTIACCAQAIIVHQESFAASLQRDFYIGPNKIAVIPLLAVPAGRSGSARAALGLAEDERILLFFGFATKYKGIELLLAAFRQMTGSGVKLLLGAGEHPKVAHMPEYEAYYSGLKRNAESIPGVVFLGFVPDARLDDYIEASDAAVFPYVEVQSASGPLTICAMHGKALLVSTRIAEKVPGLAPCAFEPDAASLASAIRRFFEDADYRKAVETQSALFAQQVTGGETVPLTIELYRKVASIP